MGICGECIWHGKRVGENSWCCMNPYSRKFEQTTAYNAFCSEHVFKLKKIKRTGIYNGREK